MVTINPYGTAGLYGARAGTPANDPLARYSGYGADPAYAMQGRAQQNVGLSLYTPTPMPSAIPLPRQSGATSQYRGGTGLSFVTPGGVSGGGSSGGSGTSDADLLALLRPSQLGRETAAERLRRLGLTQRQDIGETMNRRGLYGSGPMMEENRRQQEAEMQTLGDLEARGSAEDLAYIASFRQAEAQRQAAAQQAAEQTQAARDIAEMQNRYASQEAQQARDFQQWQIENQIAQGNWAAQEAARRAQFEAHRGGTTTAAAPAAAQQGTGSLLHPPQEFQNPNIPGVTIGQQPRTLADPNQAIRAASQPRPGESAEQVSARVQSTAAPYLRSDWIVSSSPDRYGNPRYYGHNPQTNTYRDLATGIVSGSGQPSGGIPNFMSGSASGPSGQDLSTFA